MYISYFLLNPSGNITALVEAEASAEVASEIMKKEPTCEQVGFISSKDGCDIRIDMAGGEFCGNAVLCAAAVQTHTRVAITGMDNHVNVSCSGCDDIIDVRVIPFNEDMKVCSAVYKAFDVGSFNGYPYVVTNGISHIIIEDPKEADARYEELIKEWCIELNVPALGIVLFNRALENLRPLVYVKDIDTLFWENSCASGSLAVSSYIGAKEGPCRMYLQQPGGVIKAEYKEDGTIVMANKVVVVKRDFICIQEQ